MKTIIILIFLLTLNICNNQYDDFSMVLGSHQQEEGQQSEEQYQQGEKNYQKTEDIDQLKQQYQQQQQTLQYEKQNKESQDQQQIFKKYQQEEEQEKLMIQQKLQQQQQRQKQSVFQYEDQQQQQYQQKQYHQQYQQKEQQEQEQLQKGKGHKNIELQNQLLQEFENVDSDQSLKELSTESLKSSSLEAQSIIASGLHLSDRLIELTGNTLVQFGSEIVTAEKLAVLLQMNRQLIQLCKEDLSNCQIKDNQKLDLSMLQETESMARFKELDSLINKQSDKKDNQYDIELSSIDKEIDLLF